MILIAGASAITDRHDVLPAGIEAAGGTLEHFGMPVDPGNLLLLARLDGRPVLGLPGCCRSPKLNGLDWVLQRLAAGIEVTGRDIMGMGVGGLLSEIPSRPQPREGEPQAAPAKAAALVLAAGQSRRMGGPNKLLLDGRRQAHGPPRGRGGAGLARRRRWWWCSATSSTRSARPCAGSRSASPPTPTMRTGSAPPCAPASAPCRPTSPGRWCAWATCRG